MRHRDATSTPDVAASAGDNIEARLSPDASATEHRPVMRVRRVGLDFSKRLLSRRWVKVAVEVALVVGVLYLVTAYQTRRHLKHEVAPDFALVDLSGNRVRLSEFRHKKVLLHFWATWCGVCRVELPSLRSLHRSLAADEVLLTVVEDSSDVEAVRRYASEHELGYPILLGTDETRRAYRIGAFPTNYYLNGDGTVSSTSVGLSTRLGMALRLVRATAD